MPKPITKILTGEGLAAEMISELGDKVANFRVKPSVAVVMVGLDLESEGFQKFADQAREIGMKMEAFGLEEDVEEDEVIGLIDKLNYDKKIHGILVQLPLPESMDQNRILDYMNPEKDMEGYHPQNLGWLALGDPFVVPSSVQTVLKLLESRSISTEGKNVCVLGKNQFIGMPLGQMFLSQGALVSVLPKPEAEITKKADILVCAMDDPNVVKKEMIKTHAVVIDLTGDVDYEDVKEKASYITPWPKGIESLLNATLLTNAWKAMLRNEGYDEDEVK